MMNLKNNPSASPFNKKEPSNNKRYVYILNLNKLRITVISIISTSLLLLVLVLGFVLGTFFSGNKNTQNDFVDLNKKENSLTSTNKKQTPKNEKQSKDKLPPTQEALASVETPKEPSAVGSSGDEQAKLSSNDNNQNDVVVDDSDVKDNTPTKYTRIAKPGASKKTQYFIQVLSTNNVKKVTYASSKLRKSGLRTFTKKTPNNSYILSVGVFNNASEAKKMLSKLQKNGEFSDAFIKLGYVKK